MTGTWRERATPIIARVLKSTRGKSDAEIRAALREAYPFGQRKYHPYKIWLDECRRQRGLPRLSEWSNGKPNATRDRRKEADNPGQGELFGAEADGVFF